MAKKNKPASLTSSLLARKGEAEPAEARPFLVPETHTAGTAQSGNDNGNDGGSDNGNDNGTDAGNDSSAARGGSASKDLFGLGNFPLPELSEKSLRSTELEQTDPPPADPPLAAPADPVAPTLNVSKTPPPPQRVTEPGAPSMDTAEPRVGPAPDKVPDPEILDVEQETVRDARLLKFVYVMAALTGIMAIVIYSGGWFIDDGAQKTAKQETPWTPPAQTAGKSEDAAPADRPVANDPEKSAAETPPAAAMTAGAEKPAEQPIGSDATPEKSPEKSMAAASPELPASSRVLREGAGSASKPATTEIGSALSTATPSTGVAATSSGQAPSNQAGRAPVESSAAVVADRQPPAGEPSKSAASSGSSAEAPGQSDKVVMTDKVSRGIGDSGTDKAAAPAKPEKMPSAPAEKGSTETAMTAPPAQPKASAEKAPVAMVTPSDGVAPLAKPTGRFLIQLSSVKSPERADREWARLKKRFPDQLGSLELIVEKRAIKSRGTFYRVQTGRFETISEARAICAVLAAKKQGCLPIKR